MRSGRWGVKGQLLPGRLGALPRTGALASSFFPHKQTQGPAAPPPAERGQKPSHTCLPVEGLQRQAYLKWRLSIKGPNGTGFAASPNLMISEPVLCWGAKRRVGGTERGGGPPTVSTLLIFSVVRPGPPSLTECPAGGQGGVLGRPCTPQSPGLLASPLPAPRAPHRPLCCSAKQNKP